VVRCAGLERSASNIVGVSDLYLGSKSCPQVEYDLGHPP
jgi:hypothetical protein